MKLLLILLVLAGLMGLVNSMAYEDEQQEHAFYCESVRDGIYPDYKGLMAQGACNERG